MLLGSENHDNCKLLGTGSGGLLAITPLFPFFLATNDGDTFEDMEIFL
jgi:hypothetical protein